MPFAFTGYLVFMKIFLIPFAAVMLAACQPENPQPLSMPKVQTSARDRLNCQAQELQYLVGKSETVLRVMGLTGNTRIIPHNSAVTMDYNAGRLNFLIGETGTITRIYCG